MISRRNTLKLLTGLALCPGGFHTIIQPKLIVPAFMMVHIKNGVGREFHYYLVDGIIRLKFIKSWEPEPSKDILAIW